MESTNRIATLLNQKTFVFINFFFNKKKKCSSTVCNMHKPDAGIDETNFDLSDQIIL